MRLPCSPRTVSCRHGQESHEEKESERNTPQDSPKSRNFRDCRILDGFLILLSPAKALAVSFALKLIAWYQENQRDLPWRQTRDPYRIWLSEIILQQTRVAQGEPYYQRFLENFPDVARLASAPESQVLKLWQGLGYYSRARNLHATAKIVHEKYHDRFPPDYALLRQLPGIGDYTAAAIASFAFNLSHPVVDGNVIRFICRMDGIFDEAGSPSCKKKIMAVLQERIDAAQAGLFNQALMEFGALACTPAKYLCKENPSLCPFSGQCHAFLSGQVELLPVKKPKDPLPWRELHYLLLVENGSTWIHQRGYSDLWRGLCDLPSIGPGTEAGNMAQESALPPYGGFPAKGTAHPELQFLKSYTQTLSHRKLHICFYKVEPGSRLAQAIKGDSRYREIPLESLSSVAVPKSIEKFFLEFKII